MDKTIWLLTPYFFPNVGGIEQYTDTIAGMLTNNGWSPIVLAARTEDSFPDNIPTDEERPYPVARYEQVPPRSGPFSGIRYHRAYRNTFRAAMKERFGSWDEPEMLWATVWFDVGIPGSQLAERFDCPFLLSVHGRELWKLPNEDKPRSQVLSLFRNASQCLPVSSLGKNRLTEFGVDEDRVQILPNAVDTSEYSPGGPKPSSLVKPQASHNQNSSVRILSLGRHVERKQFHVVIQSLARIKSERNLDFQYILAGTGPMHQELSDLVEENNLQSRVTMPGFVSGQEKKNLYRWSDVFVMPARSVPPEVEGFGIVFIEAGACETPSIGGRSGGIPDIINDGDTGFLVSPEDPKELVDRLVRLMKNQNLRNNMGKNAREDVVNRFSTDSVGEKLDRLLSSL